jgi:hypothetical protein
MLFRFRYKESPFIEGNITLISTLSSRYRRMFLSIRPRHRWEDNISMDLREIGFGDVDWIHWAQDRDRWRALVNTVMNLRFP